MNGVDGVERGAGVAVKIEFPLNVFGNLGTLQT